jgi:rubredoxin
MDMHSMNCPSCGTANQPIAIIDDVRDYRCQSCGLVYYGPCGCVSEDKMASDPRVDAWAMSVPAPTAFGPAVRHYRGCS